MTMINQKLTAKAEGSDLSGKRAGYAAVILQLVAQEFEQPITCEELLDFDEDLTIKEIKRAVKKLRKVFCDWFRQTISPQ